MITNGQLGVLNRRMHRLRAICEKRRMDISDIHLVDAGAESEVLAARLGSPIWWAAADPNYSIERLGINDETEIDGVPRELVEVHLA